VLLAASACIVGSAESGVGVAPLPGVCASSDATDELAAAGVASGWAAVVGAAGTAWARAVTIDAVSTVGAVPVTAGPAAVPALEVPSAAVSSAERAAAARVAPSVGPSVVVSVAERRSRPAAEAVCCASRSAPGAGVRRSWDGPVGVRLSRASAAEAADAEDSVAPAEPAFPAAAIAAPNESADAGAPDEDAARAAAGVAADVVMVRLMLRSPRS
jgi:hypothetical protein